MVEGTRENFKAIDSEEDIFEKAKLVADSGFHTENNVKMLMEEDIDFGENKSQNNGLQI